MTVVATGFPAEERIAAFGCFFIEVDARLRIRCRNRQLVEMERREEFRGQIIIRIDVWQIPKAVCSRDRELRCIVQSRIEESTCAMQLQISHKRVPIGNGAPGSRPSVLIETD